MPTIVVLVGEHCGGSDGDTKDIHANLQLFTPTAYESCAPTKVTFP